MNRKIGMMLLLLGAAAVASSQCESWEGHAKQSEAEEAHSVYRQALKTEDYEIAEEYWEKAYAIAPAADGLRDYHMIDGAKIYMNKFTNATDAAQKEEYKAKVIGFYEEAIACYESGGIKIKGDETVDQKISYLKGRLGYDMYYYMQTPYSVNYEYLMDAIKKGGNDVEYIVMDPLAKITVYQYQNKLLDKATALANFELLESIAEANTESEYAEYYQQAWGAAQAHYAPVETEIFDCEYFKESYKDEYDSNPDDMENVKTLIVLLKRRGCPDSDPFLSKLEGKWASYAAATNKARQAEFESSNPAFMAKKEYDKGNFEGAIAKYNEAIASETDPDKKASMLFSKASIQFRKLKQYNDARSTAREAGKAKSGYGRPYMLIGDMYATGARNCGDSWNQRLAVIAAIEKYSYAKSIDPSVADEADEKIGKYRSSLPEKQEGFMRGVKSGDKATVGCWIGESVTVKFN